MCLAIPSRIVSIDGLTALVDVCGARRQASPMLLPEEVGVGDYVLVHAGFAMQKVGHDVAEESLRFFAALVEEERRAGEGGEAAGEMGGVLARGTIRWGGDEPSADR